jgi:chaperonin cofactor prefoldin
VNPARNGQQVKKFDVMQQQVAVLPLKATTFETQLRRTKKQLPITEFHTLHSAGRETLMEKGSSLA